jgi:lipoprotein Spr
MFGELLYHYAKVKETVEKCVDTFICVPGFTVEYLYTFEYMRTLRIYLTPAVLLLLLFVACRGRKESTGSHPGGTSSFVKKYSEILGVPLSKECNRKFIETCASWLGTPYKYGGTSKSGADCSGFAGQVYSAAYGKTIGRSSRDIFDQCREVPKVSLREGDFVFFKIKSKKISHVGIYLTQGYFIHASTSKGVIVSNLNEEYYQKTYAGGGRLKD